MITGKGARWALAFAVFWAADMALWYVIYGASKFCHFGAPVPLTWRFAASDTWGWAAGEVVGAAIGVWMKQKRDEEQKKQKINETSE